MKKHKVDIEDIILKVIRFVLKVFWKILLMLAWACFRFAELLFASMSGWLKKLINKS